MSFLRDTKYYSLSSNSIDALKKSYLFAAHPSLNNDKYDCSLDLLDVRKVELDNFRDKLVKNRIIDEPTLQKYYGTDEQWRLDKLLREALRIITFMKFGIISLTENDLDILMWSYYAYNSGFVIKLKLDKLPDSLFGPFPINYSSSFRQIDYDKFTPAMWVHYISNIKFDKWSHESEWRYITYNQLGKYDPFLNPDDKDSRKFYYNSNAVEEITLGYDFLHPLDIEKRTINSITVKLSQNESDETDQYKRQLIEFILDKDIKCFQIIRKVTDFEFSKRELRIARVIGNRYKVSWD